MPPSEICKEDTALSFDGLHPRVIQFTVLDKRVILTFPLHITERTPAARNDVSQHHQDDQELPHLEGDDRGVVALAGHTGFLLCVITCCVTRNTRTRFGFTRKLISSVSTPMFAKKTKYSCESSRRDLHTTHLCTDLRSQNFK